jgi:tetratricopeptide (TPR) repeat protein
MKLLTDLPENNPILGFQEDADTIVSIIKNQEDICIGIFGEWGTGKTTLMKLIETKLTEHIIEWDNVNSRDKVKLLIYLNKKYNLNWQEEDVNILVNKESIKITNKNDKIEFSLELDDEEIRSLSKMDKFLAKIKKIGIDILKENTITKNYVQKQKQIILKKNNMRGDLLLGFVNSNENLTIYIDIDKEENEDLISVWFNPWKHELEEYSVSEALLKRIVFSMVEHPIMIHFKPELVDLTKKFLGKLSAESIYTLLKPFTENPQDLIKNLDYMNQIFDSEKKSIYYDGSIILENKIKQIRKGSPNFKIIVFIDDLDRCSHTTVFKVFESIKVLLGLEGFTYVIGLSERKIKDILIAEYKKIVSDDAIIQKFYEQYINKIIQTSFRLPDYSSNDILKLTNYYSELLNDDEFSEIVTENSDFIVLSSNHNPRDLKRLLNFIKIRHKQFHQNTSISMKETIFLIVLHHSWNEIYKRIIMDGDFRAVFNRLIRIDYDEIGLIFKSNIQNPIFQHDPLTQDHRRIFLYETMNDFHALDEKNKNILKEIPAQIWEYFTQSRDTILNIDWNSFSPYFLKKEITVPSKPDPNIEQRLLQKASDYYLNKKYLQGSEVCDNLIKFNQNNSYYYNLKGMCLTGLADFERAIKSLEKSIDLEKASENLYNLGLVYDKLSYLNISSKSNYFHKAIYYLEESLIINPNYGPALYQLSIYYYRIGKFDSAFKIYEKILNMNNNDIFALNGLGLVSHYYYKKYEDAIKYFEIALDISLKKKQKVNNWFLYYNIAQVKENIYRYKEHNKKYIVESKEFLKQALESNPSNEDCKNMLQRLELEFPTEFMYTN